MNKKIMICCFFLVLSLLLKAQTHIAEQIASHIAQKMQDSLSLTNGQKNSIYAINIQLNNRKMAARKQYSGTALETRIQAIENTRDTLYHLVLMNDATFQLYRQKKRNLVSNE